MLVQIQFRAVRVAEKGPAPQASANGDMMTRDSKDSSQPLLNDLIRVEERLAEALRATAREVGHTECLDGEQRAEVYTILDALRNDTNAHRAIVGRWVGDRGGND